MNVGTEAFQDGFWLIGNEGFFSGNPESDLLLGMAGGAIHDQTYAAQSPDAAGRFTGPSSRMTGASPRRSPSTSAWHGI
jgi:hypothetical protein